MISEHLRPPVILVDGSIYLFRGYHGAPNFTNSKGRPTGAIRAVVSMLLRLLDDYPDSPVIVIFDSAKPTFRHTMYKEYKANRPPMPEELSLQIEPLYAVIKSMGLPLLIEDGYEADDIIGTLATQATELGLETIVSTSDKDMAQLVNEHVTLLDTMAGKAFKKEDVIEKFGVPPERIIDYLALVGDTSDNIPGVPKVGPKTAARWLNQYGDLASILRNRDQITGKVGENLRAAVEHIPLSRDLATIKCEVPLNLNISDFQRAEMDIEELTKWFNELEFRTLLRQVTTPATAKFKENTDAIFEIVTDPLTLDVWVKRIRERKKLSLELLVQRDLGANYQCRGIALCADKERAAYIPIDHIDESFRQLDFEHVIDQLRPLMEDGEVEIIGNDLKQVISAFVSWGIQVEGALADTALMSYVLLSNAPGGHRTASLASRHLNMTTIDRLTLTGSGSKRIPFAQVKIPEATCYMAELAHTNLRLSEDLRQQLQEQFEDLDLYDRIEQPLTRVLATVERNGVRVSKEPIKKLGQELDERIERLVEQAYDVTGEQFSLNSPKQIQEVLFDKLKLTSPRRTRSGMRSTSEDVLRELVDEHELPQIILDYRTATKLNSTYVEQLLNSINSDTQRIHTWYDQTSASTGRLASSNPNLQNIPVRSPEGRRLREAFVAEEGNVLLSADYSQIELRIMAHFAADESLREAFEADLDIHRVTAAEIFDTPYEEVSESMRRDAKAINFGLIYGMSAFGLARNIGTSRTEAGAFIDRYFYRYPGVLTYMEETKRIARSAGYVETLMGRRIHLPDINQADRVRRVSAERVAINAPIQGTAADIMKCATIAVDQALTHGQYDARMVLHIHDEIVFEVAEDQVREVSNLVTEVMQQTANLTIDLVVDTGVGKNWSEAH